MFIHNRNFLFVIAITLFDVNMVTKVSRSDNYKINRKHTLSEKEHKAQQVPPQLIIKRIS